MTLAESVADQLLQDVIDGRLPAPGPLPTEPELAARFSVSRMTVREAVRILRAQNVVRIIRGLGTEVNAPEQWTSLSAAVRLSAGLDGGEALAARRLLEARRMIEVGAAQLAAERRTEEDVIGLEESVAALAAATADGDLEAIVAADLRFHEVLLAASQNIFVPLLFESLGPLLVSMRRRTSAIPEIRESALLHHRQILAAVRSGDADRARIAMEAHLSPEETERLLAEFHAHDAQGHGTTEAERRDLA